MGADIGILRRLRAQKRKQRYRLLRPALPDLHHRHHVARIEIAAMKIENPPISVFGLAPPAGGGRFIRILAQSRDLVGVAHPSVPIPKFASSRYRAPSEFRNRRTLGNYRLIVSLG